MKKTSVFNNGLIWFGAGVSIAEIGSGTVLAGLGWHQAILAVIIGHVIGCMLMICAGLIGAKSGLTAMETVKLTFGKAGGLFFAALNVLQLVGWTSIMIYDGGVSAAGIFDTNYRIWALVIGVLIALLVIIGLKSLGIFYIISTLALLGLCIVIGILIFRDGGAVFTAKGDSSLAFGEAVELSAAMPISWLPLISDYTSEAEKPVVSTIVSSVIYGLVSCFMYIIGIGAVLKGSSGDIAVIMSGAGLGAAGLAIIVLATVTTTFLDAYSSGVSFESITRKISGKMVAFITAVIGTVLALFFNMDNIADFLYLIGSVFTPMIGVMIVNSLIFKNDERENFFSVTNFLIWVAGFMCYRYFLTVGTPIGETVPALVITCGLSVILMLVKKARK